MQLLAISFLSMSSLLIFSVPLQAASERQEEALKNDVDGDLGRLESPDSMEREDAAYTLNGRATGNKAEFPYKKVIPRLIKHLEDPNPKVRAAVVLNLGEIVAGSQLTGTTLDSIGQKLTNRLSDSNPVVRYGAADAAGKVGSRWGGEVKTLMTLELSQLLQDEDTTLRYKAAYASIQVLQSEASNAAIDVVIETLRESLQDESSNTTKTQRIKVDAINALGKTRSRSQVVINLLLKSLDDENPKVRESAAQVLGKTKSEDILVANSLIKILKDEEPGVRLASVVACSELSLDTPETASQVIKALLNIVSEDKVNSSRAVESIATIARHFRDNKKKLSKEKLERIVQELENAHNFLVSSLPSPSEHREESHISLNNLKIYLDELRDQKNNQSNNFLMLLRQNPFETGLAAFAIYYLIYLGVFIAKPCSLIYYLSKIEDLNIKLIIVELKIPIRLILNPAKYHSKVLDAWIRHHVRKTARSNFRAKPTVKECQTPLPLPIRVGNQTMFFALDQLKAVLLEQQRCLMIYGESGAGKTSLACRLAGWAMEEEFNQRLCKYQRLPVLIEGVSLTVAEGKHPLKEAILAEIQQMTSEQITNELCEQLLLQQRLLIIVDRVSEMSEEMQREINLNDTSFSFALSSLVVTSRLREILNPIAHDVLEPLSLQPSDLKEFLKSYITKQNYLRSEQQNFSEQSFEEASTQLVKIVKHQGITVLFVKLYAEYMLSREINTQSPKDISELVLTYLNQLNTRTSRFDFITVQQAAKKIAWLCLKEGFRPLPIEKTMAAGIIGDNKRAREILEHLEELQLIQTVGTACKEISFLLDPLAEYLAAMYIIENFGDDQTRWRKEVIDKVILMGTSTIQGFLQSLYDCCLADKNNSIPQFVVSRLSDMLIETELSLNVAIEQSEPCHHEPDSSFEGFDTEMPSKGHNMDVIISSENVE